MFWHVIDFFKTKMHLTGHIIDVWHFMYDSLFGILAFYLADFFWHSIWYSFGSQILCFMFWLVICCSIGHSIWHARHGILSDIDWVQRRAPAQNHWRFHGWPVTSNQGSVAHGLCNKARVIWYVATFGYSRPMELPWKGCCAPLWRHIISRGSTKRWSGFLQSDGDVLLKSLLSITSPAYPIGSMVLLYMVTWIPSIYPLYVSIYTSTMDPMGIFSCFETSLIF